MTSLIKSMVLGAVFIFALIIQGIVIVAVGALGLLVGKTPGV